MMAAMTEATCSAVTLRHHDTLQDIPAAAWDDLLAAQDCATPFMRHAYLSAMHTSASACPATGWQPHVISLWRGPDLAAACIAHLKAHSYGEYVFDWAWADAYARHGLDYYPKAIVASPFTPVPGARLLARNASDRTALLRALQDWAGQRQLSSLHLLFAAPQDLAAARQLGWMQRETVQFHWHNRHPQHGRVFHDFDDFLASLSQDKRKKIRQERRKVAQAGVGFRALEGRGIEPADWDFFYACYERTYLEHRNRPYLTRDFFSRMAADMPEAWVLFVAERQGHPIACSLVATDDAQAPAMAYGRYWGALERVDCLHFEACYYQPIAWCIARGVARFEGGAQGEHKLARALLPVAAHSAHWLAHPAFAHAVHDYLERETPQVESYLQLLQAHSPFRQVP